MGNILYGFLAAIDWVVYKLASSLFVVICDIAEANFFTQTQIDKVANRVYLILGVLILFEVIISAIQFLVDPDKFEDKEKGFAGIIKKTIITMALIVVVPVIFRFALDIQTTIVESIPNIILGNEVQNYNDKDKLGEKLSFTVLSSFVKAREGRGGSVGSSLTNGKDTNEIHNIDTFRDYVNTGCDLQLWGMSSNCKYDYMIIISTFAGGFLCYILLTMALDIAVRTIKLGIIQMLAPIPISTYIFSKDKFNKFVKISLQVYTDLFIRMAIVYFIIFAFTSVIDNGFINIDAINGGVSNTGLWFRNVLVNLAIIFGLLMFAKSAPKFLTDLLGLPEISGGDMADMFKPAWKRVGGLSGAAAGIGAYRNSKEYGEKGILPIRRALSAGAHAMISRLRDAASGKSLDESYKTSRESAMARTNKNLEYRNRYGDRRERFRQRRREWWDSYTGVTTGGKKASATIDAANKAISTRSDIWGRAEEKVLEKNAAGYKANIDITDLAGIKHNYTASKLLTRIAEIEGGAKQSFTGELQQLKEKRQEVIDLAKMEFIQQSITGSGDGKARNKLAEDIFAFMRSGGDSREVGKILNQTVEDVTDSNGNYVGDVQLDLADVANTIAKGDAIDGKTAAALAKYIQGYAGRDGLRHGIESDAGAMRVRATQTQTSVPKDN